MHVLADEGMAVLMSSDSSASRVRAWRRIAVRIGLGALALAWSTVFATACIFEKGDYQGGGRKDQGAEGTTAAPSASTAPTPTGTNPDGTPRDAAPGG